MAFTASPRRRLRTPDLDHFSGRGAKDTVPLYRTADGTEANILPGLLNLLGNAYGCKVTPEAFLAYVYGALAQPVYTACYAKELETRELRVPIAGQEALGRTRRQGFHLLDSVRGHDVLPVGPR